MKLNELLVKTPTRPYRANGRWLNNDGGQIAYVESAGNELKCLDGCFIDDALTASYLAHAANVLPQLVRALAAAKSIIEEHDETSLFINNEPAGVGLRTLTNHDVDPDGVEGIFQVIREALEAADTVDGC